MEDRMVSVIIPTYNRREVIQRAIDSVLNQTYQNFEIIVIDDASNDSTHKILQSYHDKRIRYYHNTENIGANSSRNIGIQKACGELIAFLDSDDEWDEKKLEMQLLQLQGGICWGFSAFTYIKEGTENRIPEQSLEVEIQKKRLSSILKKKNIVSTITLIVEKDKLLKIGLFDESMPRLQDYELAIRLVKNYDYFYIPDSLATAYFTKISINTNHKAFLKATKLILCNHKDFFGKEAIYKCLQGTVDFCVNSAVKKEEVREFLCQIKESNMISKEEYINLIEYMLENLLSYSSKTRDYLKKQKEYLKTIVIRQQKYYIYGAGYKAQKLYIELEGYTDNLNAFVVTEKKDNADILFSKPIIEVAGLIEEKNILIIVAMDCKHFNEIEENLKFYGFENIYFWN